MVVFSLGQCATLLDAFSAHGKAFVAERVFPLLRAQLNLILFDGEVLFEGSKTFPACSVSSDHQSTSPLTIATLHSNPNASSDHALWGLLGDSPSQANPAPLVAPLLRVSKACRRLTLCYPELLAATAGLVEKECDLANRRLLPVRAKGKNGKSVSVNALLEFAETLGYFGVLLCTKNSSKSELVLSDTKNLESSLTSLILYAERFISCVTEKGAIDLTSFLAFTGLSMKYPWALFLGFRKIGLGTAWERHKVRIFSLWLAQQLEWQDLDVDLPKRCVTEGMRAWRLGKTDNRELGAELKNVVEEIFPGKACEVGYYVEDSPYMLDAFFARSRLGVIFTNEVSRNRVWMERGRERSNTRRLRIEARVPVAGARLMQTHLRGMGYHVEFIQVSEWKSLLSRHTFVQNLLGGYLEDTKVAAIT